MFRCSALTIFLFSEFNCCSVTIVSRDDWKANCPRHKELQRDKAQRVVIHHTDTKSGSNMEEMITIVKGIQSDHITNRKFDDIGYK